MCVISKHGWLNDLTNAELQELYAMMTKRRQQADENPKVDEVYNTNNADYQELYDALAYVMNIRGLV